MKNQKGISSIIAILIIIAIIAVVGISSYKYLFSTFLTAGQKTNNTQDQTAKPKANNDPANQGRQIGGVKDCGTFNMAESPLNNPAYSCLGSNMLNNCLPARANLAAASQPVGAFVVKGGNLSNCNVRLEMNLSELSSWYAECKFDFSKATIYSNSPSMLTQTLASVLGSIKLSKISSDGNELFNWSSCQTGELNQ